VDDIIRYDGVETHPENYILRNRAMTQLDDEFKQMKRN
jgi:hypothetical protein